MEGTVSQAKRLAEQGRTDECISYLAEFLGNYNVPLYEELLILSGRFKHLESLINRGTIDSDKSILEHSKLLTSLVRLIGKIENSGLNKGNQTNLSTSTSPILIGEKFGINLMKGLPDFKDEFSKSQKVSILGTVLTGTLSRYTPNFQKILSLGGELRFLTSEPLKEVFEMQKFRSSSIKDNEFMFNASLNSRKSILKLKQKDHKGIVSLKTVPILPPFILVIFEDHIDMPKVFVRIMAFKISSTEQPVLSLNEREHSEWYIFFKNQFELLWQEGNLLTLENMDEKFKLWKEGLRIS